MDPEPLFGSNVKYAQDGRAVAAYSRDMKYRYYLRRELFGGMLLPPKARGRCVWIMLNPSTATEDKMDPTVTRCRNFSQQWGFQQMAILNLFAYRATEPGALYTLTDPIGPENDRIIRLVLTDLRATDRLMLAWGAHGELRGRATDVYALVREHSRVPGECLDTVGNGQPRHPLYSLGTLDPRAWSENELAKGRPKERRTAPPFVPNTHTGRLTQAVPLRLKRLI